MKQSWREREEEEGGRDGGPSPTYQSLSRSKVPAVHPGGGGEDINQSTEEVQLHFSDKRCGALFMPLGPSHLELCPVLAASTMGCSSDSVKGNRMALGRYQSQGEIKTTGWKLWQVQEQPAL